MALLIFRMLFPLQCLCFFAHFSLAMPVTACSVAEKKQVIARQKVAKAAATRLRDRATETRPDYDGIFPLKRQRVYSAQNGIAHRVISVRTGPNNTTGIRFDFEMIIARQNNSVETWRVNTNYLDDDNISGHWAMYLDYVSMREKVTTINQHAGEARFVNGNDSVDIIYHVKGGPLSGEIISFYSSHSLDERSELALSSNNDGTLVEFFHTLQRPLPYNGGLRQHAGSSVKEFIGLLSVHDRKSYIIDQIIIGSQQGEGQSAQRYITFKVKNKVP